MTRVLGLFSITAAFFASDISHPVYVDRTDIYRIVKLPAPIRNRDAELLATWRKALSL
jgi:hypothetical protein